MMNIEWNYCVSNILNQFNFGKTIVALMCQQISSTLFKNEITYKLFTYKSY